MFGIAWLLRSIVFVHSSVRGAGSGASSSSVLSGAAEFRGAHLRLATHLATAGGGARSLVESAFKGNTL